jgi:hypothetical protein
VRRLLSTLTTILFFMTSVNYYFSFPFSSLFVYSAREERPVLSHLFVIWILLLLGCREMAQIGVYNCGGGGGHPP